MRRLRPALALLAICLALPATAQSPGWRYSPLPGEGDRATLGCDRDATPEDFTCLVIRCEDDFTAGVHVWSSRPGGDVGLWDLGIDRETFTLETIVGDAPYGARFAADEAMLLERLRHGAQAYLGFADDPAGASPIDLAGSFAEIHRALAFCAPRRPAEPEPAIDTEIE